MSEYPPEVENLIRAALDATEGAVGWNEYGSRLVEAANAYRKATAPPEPFEAYMKRWTDDEDPWGNSLFDAIPTGTCAEVWKVTVTPIERVRP